MITEMKSIVFIFVFLSQNVSICMTEVTECENNGQDGNPVLLCAGLTLVNAQSSRCMMVKRNLRHGDGFTILH